ncbi:uncharacterized protein BCR38DRAFT_6994 [Pseudomassariella vexata]|uniref:Uncharacterized protein n=1 Tax=Pseudomassariella vexata TaxID=1141098 RepID=A0A1Y2EK96_9PEZI|nr:uncharacterized protein BCR38DRAFT_6994 [Pseudomassariella vexata]ORY71265.1 hypothetical protein BCR38DRAFT_6994 [Pseudomassariella vexata]
MGFPFQRYMGVHLNYHLPIAYSKDHASHLLSPVVDYDETVLTLRALGIKVPNLVRQNPSPPFSWDQQDTGIKKGSPGRGRQVEIFGFSYLSQQNSRLPSRELLCTAQRPQACQRYNNWSLFLLRGTAKTNPAFSNHHHHCQSLQLRLVVSTRCTIFLQGQVRTAGRGRLFGFLSGGGNLAWYLRVKYSRVRRHDSNGAANTEQTNLSIFHCLQSEFDYFHQLHRLCISSRVHLTTTKKATTQRLARLSFRIALMCRDVATLIYIYVGSHQRHV